ncbi:maleylacetoacetate isomerase [Bordetella pseudohinzii]|uniref:Maleylacetoacetate isomerase n=1 Tax=Bordetella pseudohinzii TaxID=1331258 RepID=A0A0J6BZL1_9BORD|nr:maleylacetoacetate isomerase [Bordetella pseudohinzii]ANY17057.1 maleylacetoacetate isomerase [Bordetella pseudohinzii]KMM23951.1 maleylacetoacetate isomerase [Bordetella pseudohinzii]KXA76501.1 maleylacetoacetate isomerase [Bordetella pseudohinzii]KXA76853.1 maleylacetoacetate isomerase [Bordetella pseudohinzii]CUJ18265.1 Stringent starvation protein A homolog [Bordetella pseudohinzii]
MQLFSYFRSSAAYRVRIALNLKGLPYDYKPVHLLKDGGQQLSEGYRALNPAALVPTLVDGDHVIGQSLAIIEYLDETHPAAPLLPATPAARARVRAIALSIACDTHPLNNLRVLKYLKHEVKAAEEVKNAWYRHWVDTGLAAVESMLANSSETGRFCHGDTPTLADLCLVPQVFNARRFGCDLTAMPTILRIDEACNALPAFQKAAPENQPDAE